MLEQEVIEHTQTEWSLPIVFTPKNETKLGFCVEYK